jgi:nucleotide-binding universal stress UspA family protein
MAGSIKNILWPTDFSPEGQAALLYAGLFAKAFSAQITALHVHPDLGLAIYADSPIIVGELEKRKEKVDKQAQARLEAIQKKKGLAFKKVVVTEGSPAKKIIATAEKEKADLIVMGKKGESTLERVLIGSVANHVLRHSPVPVLMTKKGKPPLTIKKILVPTDFTKEEDLEREVAWDLAQSFGAALTFLYVLELYGHEYRMVDHMFEHTLVKFQKRAAKGRKGVEVLKDVTRAFTAAAGIEKYSRERGFDLIVMATCARALGRFFLGSTTEKVIAATNLPVFAIPPHLCR